MTKRDDLTTGLIDMIDKALVNRLQLCGMTDVVIKGKTGNSISFKVTDQGIVRSFVVKLKEK